MKRNSIRICFISAWLILFSSSVLIAGQNISEQYKKSPNPGSKDREYTVHLPTGYTGDRPLPLVVVLHGCLQDNDVIQHDTKFDDIADEEGFIAVYPFVTSYDGMRSENCWGFWFDDEIHRGIGEVGDIYGIIQRVKKDYNIDPNRIHITGLSSGGAMTTVVMVAYPDIIASGAVGAGIAYGETANAVKFRCSPFYNGIFESVSQTVSEMEEEMKEQKRPVPVLIFHSEDDCVVDIQAAENNRDAWAGLFGVDLESPVYETSGTTRGRSWTYRKYGNIEGRTNIETHFVKGPDHAWIGGAEGKYADPDGPDWSEIAWDFFESHPLGVNQKPAVTITSGVASERCITVKGVASDPDGSVANVKVALDGIYPQAPSEAELTGDGSYSATLCNLPDNARYIPVAVATDDGNARSDPVTGDCISLGNPPENAPPSVKINPVRVNEQCVRLTGTAKDDREVARAEVRLDGGKWVAVPLDSGKWRYEKCGLAEGTHSFAVRAEDKECGITTETGPDFTIRPPAYEESVSDTLTNHVAARRVRYYASGAGFGAFDVSYMDLYSEYGGQTEFILYRVGDPPDDKWYAEKGNIPGVSRSDDSPALTVGLPEVVDHCVIVGGTVTDEDGVRSVEVKIGNDTAKQAGVYRTGWRYSQCDLPEGEYYLAVKATDSRSRTTLMKGPSFRIGAVSEAPTVSIDTSALNNTCISLAGTADDDTSVAEIAVQVGQPGSWEDVVRSGHAWRFDRCGYESDHYVVSVRATDTQGLSATAVSRLSSGDSPSVFCREHTSSNTAHILRGRAYPCGIGFWETCALGSGTNLGLNNIFTTTTLKESPEGHYEEGKCE
ncbi:hypothetical protein DENIS_1965 [Desulfonema ishimotonii]|uniref:Esterase n=1 Tax=Desulfonema ishimotonii TaxID=45657 RepID=A0A401FVL6_9BACT|nr:PHB depolymerase family esterase [Desulfonema ishimotonii]GBC61005.1 hypothetical protein DENIS_1965 [Desulfonema ishimotonii]